jgi:predicted permease
LIGKRIQVNGVPNTVLGILPRGFRMPLEFQSRTAVQLLMPLRLDPGSVSGNHNYYSIARLQPGVTEARVNAELKALTARWIGEGRYPPEMQFSAFAVPIAKEIGGSFQTPLLVLLGAVALLLLITCANIANLMLARADSRIREMTVRAALGAGRHRLLRMTLTESLLLALTGGFIGLGLAFIGVRLLATAAATSIPRAAELGVDGRVLGFMLVVSLATGLLFGILPALQLSQSNLIANLREGGRAGESRERRRGRGLLVSAEMALAVMLVIGAVLMVKSFRNLANVDPGFDPSSTLTLRISLPDQSYPETADLVRFYEAVGNEVRQLPGVKAAGFGRLVPLVDEMGDAGLAIDGKPAVSRSADWQIVGPGYFEAQGMRLVSGRFIDQTDTPDGQQVIMINQALADQYFPGEDPLGQRIRLGDPTRPWRTVVGIVANTRHHGLLGPIKREWFLPHSQLANSWGSTRRSMALVVRTTGAPSQVLEPIRRLIAARDPDLPLSQIATMDEVMSGAVREQRFTTSLMAGFAALALALAAVGIFAVVSYSVSRRTREIGIRLALGAESGTVQRLVVRQGMAPALIGIAAGIVLAAGLSRFLSSLLYGVQPRDPSTYVLIPLCLLAVALGATLLPARRATRVDLVTALRDE